MSDDFVMTKEIFRELWQEEELDLVDRHSDDSWRHGSYVTATYEYQNEFYTVQFQLSGDGEYHGIRENDFQLWVSEKLVEVKEIISYKPVNIINQ